MLRRPLISVRVFYPDYNREDLIEKISEKLPDLTKKLDLRLVVLFGSYAKQNYTIGSDVDVLIVHESSQDIDAYRVVKKTFNISRLEPHIYSFKEYQEMKHDISKMIKGGFILFEK